MGGGHIDTISPLLSSADKDSLLELQLQDYPFELSALLRGDDNSSSKVDDDDDGSVIGEKSLMLERFDDMGSQSYRDSLYFTANRKRARSGFIEVLRSYDEVQCRIESLEEAKLKILRYKPGTWTEKVGGMELRDYIVPKTTSLLLIGPQRSGKSSLVNRISRVFDDDKFSPDRAQVSYNCNDGDGTYFLQENMIPRGSSSFCLYDTRSLSDNESENTEMLKQWMTEGVHHGDLVIRNSDGAYLRNKLKCRSHQNLHCFSKTRMVNFVIFVVSGLSVLNSMDSDDESEDGYNKMIATMFNCPFLSFKDDKPVVVVTHGDLLSLSDRARVRVHLGELLGVPPKKQIFDIPDDSDPATDLTIFDLLRYSLEHADKNLPAKGWFLGKICKVWQPGSLILVLILGIAMISALVRDAYVYNGNRLHVSQTDAPIGRNANNASQADSPYGMNTVHAPKADALHVSQTDARTGRNADNHAQTNTTSGMNTIHARKTDADNQPQTDSPGMNTMHAHKTDASRLPKKETSADNRPQTDTTPGMNTMHARKTDASRLPKTKTSADNCPQTDTLSGMKKMHAHKTHASYLPKKRTSVYPSTTDVPTKDASFDWTKARLWLGSEY